jgi:hypothetical protein
VVAVAFVLLAVVLMMARRYAQRGLKRSPEARSQLSVEKLQEMHRSGLISREEFSALRRSALGLGGPGGARPLSGLTQAPRDVDENKKPEAREDPPPGDLRRGEARADPGQP